MSELSPVQYENCYITLNRIHWRKEPPNALVMRSAMKGPSVAATVSMRRKELTSPTPSKFVRIESSKFCADFAQSELTINRRRTSEET